MKLPDPNNREKAMRDAVLKDPKLLYQNLVEIELYSRKLLEEEHTNKSKANQAYERAISKHKDSMGVFEGLLSLFK
jgi:hypothetical protein